MNKFEKVINSEGYVFWDEPNGFVDGQDKLFVKWRVEGEKASLSILLYDQSINQSYTYQKDYTTSELSPEKCVEAYKKGVKTLYLNQEEVCNEWLPAFFDKWSERFPGQPTAEDFKEVCSK